MKLNRNLWLLLSLFGFAASAERVADLPTPLPASYVSDVGGLLAADTRAELDRLAATIDDAGTGQLAIVVIGTTDGADHRQFATELFNRWGVGHAQQDDGTLILLARADRAAEIVLGTAIDHPGNRAHAQQVMDSEMIPRFRSGDYDQALVAGATAVLQSVYSINLARPSEAPVDPAGAALDGSATPLPVASARRDSQGQSTPDDRPTGAVAMGLSILAAIVGFVGWLFWKIAHALWWLVGSRFFPRRCSACSTQMNLLGEAEDDALLAPEQRTEERLKSVNHRVFVCPGCSRVDKLSRRAWFSSFANCERCRSRAVSRVSRTIDEPTRASTGLAEVTESCQHCNHSEVSRKTLARLPPPSSSSSSGRSFGGGRSSGGGASGRW